jgi:iron complex outermembrane receptor protein
MEGMRGMQYRRLAAAALMALGVNAALSVPAHAEPSDLTDLGIDQLMNLPVTTAAKKPQKLADSAAAIYVLSSDDIRRSGATSLPDLLLMVPGVDGGAINSHTAAIGIRGLGGQWSNKLLVLVDGRSVYTRTFSGVYWDSYNLVFEDIERIEVIRGPNAALWGANAVNGVINIITKTSSATPDTLLRASVGTRGNHDVAVRQGFQLGGSPGSSGFARIYANGETHGASALYANDQSSGGEANDDWSSQRAGFRTDWTLRTGDRLTLQGDFYDTVLHNDPLDAEQIRIGVWPIGITLDRSANARGHSLQGNWTHASGLASEWSAQLSWARADRDEFLTLIEDNYDLDLQQRLQPLPDHDLVWGLNARYRRDDISTRNGVSFNPQRSSEFHYSLFFQDEIRFADGRYRISLGSRFEHDEYNNWEIQPSLRALWSPSEQHKVWAAISRAARTPSRVDRDMSVELSLLIDLPDRGPTPTELDFHGDKDFKTETLLAYELGYRVQSGRTTSIDIALFHNRYRDLRSTRIDSISTTPSGLLVVVPLTNSMQGNVYGGELVVNWAPRTDLRLQAFWSELRLSMHEDMNWDDAIVNQNYEGNSPRRQLGLRSDWDFTEYWSADLQLKYVGALEQPFNQPLVRGGRIPSYIDADLRVAWQVLPTLELAVLGKNLLDASRLEFSSESGPALTENRRAGYLRAVWSF